MVKTAGDQLISFTLMRDVMARSTSLDAESTLWMAVVLVSDACELIKQPQSWVLEHW